MATYKIKEGQTLIDVALQLYGHAEMIVKVCQDNSLGLHTPLLGGQNITYDETLAVDDDNVNYYRLNVMDVLTADETTNQGPYEHNAADHNLTEHN